MLDVWKEKQKEEESIFVPNTPDFAYGLVDKLHKELYLQNRQLLDSERQQLQLTQQETEAEKSEMLSEIHHLEDSITAWKGEAAKKDDELRQAEASLEKSQEKLGELTAELHTQKVEIATLTEREKQQSLQLKEKDALLQRAEKTEQSLNKQIEDLMKNLSK